MVPALLNIRLKDLLLPSARMHSDGYSSWVCVCECQCVCLLLNISLLQCSFVSQTTTYLTANEGQNVCAVFSENAP